MTTCRDKLQRIESTIDDYCRWLSPEFPEVVLVLKNLQAIADGTQSLCASHPPSEKGPWTVSAMREVLRDRDLNWGELRWRRLVAALLLSAGGRVEIKRAVIANMDMRAEIEVTILTDGTRVYEIRSPERPEKADQLPPGRPHP